MLGGFWKFNSNVKIFTKNHKMLSFECPICGEVSKMEDISFKSSDLWTDVWSEILGICEHSLGKFREDF